MSCMHGNDLKTIKCHEECKIISYEAMKFVRNVLVLHCKVLPLSIPRQYLPQELGNDHCSRPSGK